MTGLSSNNQASFDTKSEEHSASQKQGLENTAVSGGGKSHDVVNLVEFEFKVSGMTCVACSSSIERLMHNEFDKKGMVSVSIVLLTHKMTAVFEAEKFSRKEVTPEIICDEIDCIGFGAKLSSMSEICS